MAFRAAQATCSVLLQLSDPAGMLSILAWQPAAPVLAALSCLHPHTLTALVPADMPAAGLQMMAVEWYGANDVRVNTKRPVPLVTGGPVSVCTPDMLVQQAA